MATGSVLISPGNVIFPDGSSSNLAPGLSRRQGTQTGAKIHYLTIDFDGGTLIELCFWNFKMPVNYASGGSLVFDWQANATANAVKWQAKVLAVTAADADTMLEHAYAAAATVTTNINTTEANRVITSTISLTMDSAAAGDEISIMLFRDPTDAADTATSVDASFINGEFQYTTT